MQIGSGITIGGGISVSVPPPPPSVEYLVVAGGGGGGRYGGGGGAGGLLYATDSSLTLGITYTITVGNGGTVGQSAPGGQGGNSSISGSGFTTVTAIGGGGGAAGDMSGSAGNGGSGGGASGSNRTVGKGVYPGSTYLDQARQGYDGGVYDGSGGIITIWVQVAAPVQRLVVHTVHRGVLG
jgi:hypothetical protein